MFENNDIHNKFLDICDIIAKFSHCRSMKVGCILVKDKRIISTGYNGTPAGTMNCDVLFGEQFDREEHHKFSETAEIHAEINTILTAAKYGISIENTILYTNLQPCANCLKMICNSGIKEVYYRNEYDKANYPEYLKTMISQVGLKLHHIV